MVNTEETIPIKASAYLDLVMENTSNANLIAELKKDQEMLDQRMLKLMGVVKAAKDIAMLTEANWTLYESDFARLREALKALEPEWVEKTV